MSVANAVLNQVRESPYTPEQREGFAYMLRAFAIARLAMAGLAAIACFSVAMSPTLLGAGTAFFVSYFTYEFWQTTLNIREIVANPAIDAMARSSDAFLIQHITQKAPLIRTLIDIVIPRVSVS